MYECNVILLLTAPDAELLKANETYQLIGRNIEMPFVPSVGMVITVGTGTSNHEEELSRFLELSRKLPQVTGYFHIKSVNYDVDDGEISIYVEGTSFATVEELHMGLELYKRYGFDLWV